MGRDAEYHPCPISEGGEMSPVRWMKKLSLPFLGGTTVLSLVLFLIFLILYVKLESSEPFQQLEECRSQMQNRSSQTQAEITSLSQDMEAMNKTLADTKKNWHSCQNRLSALQGNFASLEAEDRSQKEEIKNLQQQLADKSKQLEDAQRKLQDERMSHQAEIEELRNQKQQHTPNRGGRDFAGPISILLTIIIVGFLSM